MSHKPPNNAVQNFGFIHLFFPFRFGLQKKNYTFVLNFNRLLTIFSYCHEKEILRNDECTATLRYTRVLHTDKSCSNPA